MVLVPKAISDDIRSLLSKVGVSSRPLYILCQPIQGAPQNECFPLVDARVSSEGGQRVLGWEIFQTQLVVEAEFLAVWKSPTGELVDITPKPFEKILFVPDSRAKYEGKQVDNFRINTTGNPLVDELIAVYEAVFRIENKGERALQREVSLSGREYTAHRKLTEAKCFIEEMALQGNTRKSPCPCSSGKKYTVCHGKVIRNLANDI